MEIVSDNYILKISNIVEYENYIIKKYEHRFNFIDFFTLFDMYYLLSVIDVSSVKVELQCLQ